MKNCGNRQTVPNLQKIEFLDAILWKKLRPWNKCQTVRDCSISRSLILQLKDLFERQFKVCMSEGHYTASEEHEKNLVI